MKRTNSPTAGKSWHDEEQGSLARATLTRQTSKDSACMVTATYLSAGRAGVCLGDVGLGSGEVVLGVCHAGAGLPDVTISVHPAVAMARGAAEPLLTAIRGCVEAGGRGRTGGGKRNREAEEANGSTNLVASESRSREITLSMEIA